VKSSFDLPLLAKSSTQPFPNNSWVDKQVSRIVLEDIKMLGEWMRISRAHYPLKWGDSDLPQKKSLPKPQELAHHRRRLDGRD
jgi:hypothetical protein